jgi:hypothetical protein
MSNYFLNSQAQANGDHEVHQLDCKYLPSAFNRVLLGSFISCDEAVEMARSKYHPSKINGCYYCANTCHTS